MKFNLIYLICISLILNSCISVSKLNYFQDEQENKGKIPKYDGPKFEVGDILQITLYSENNELNELFSPKESRISEFRQNYTSGVPTTGGFNVDENGFITIPNIGKVKAVGLTKVILENEIENRLKEFINNPIVQVQLMNFKITILGDVKSPGVYQVPNDKMTILEALAIAGDMNYSANRLNLKLIRFEGDSYKSYQIDLTKSDIFSKEYFYLKQNDILFANTTSIRTNQLNYSQYVFPILSSLSIFITLINLLR
jgi:polysaccharide export outer membrane protein